MKVTNTMRTLGSSAHSNAEREPNDYYATPPKAVELLLNLEEFSSNIWEPACGAGHIGKVLDDFCFNVKATDLIYRGYGKGDINFLENTDAYKGDIITNPPFSLALEFINKALQSVNEGSKVAMFLKLQFLESKTRRRFFEENPPKTVWVSSSRLTCAKGGMFDEQDRGAMAYAWFIWVKGFKGETVLKWFN